MALAYPNLVSICTGLTVYAKRAEIGKNTDVNELSAFERDFVNAPQTSLLSDYYGDNCQLASERRHCELAVFHSRLDSLYTGMKEGE